MNAKRAALTLALVLAPTVITGALAQPSEPLGRLFFTPERRAALERQRQLNIQETQTLEGATMSLDGIVVRSGGKRTVWINKQAQHDDAAPSGVAVAVPRRNPGRAVLSAGEESPASLRVGESINRATREKARGVDDGQITVHRAAPPKD